MVKSGIYGINDLTTNKIVYVGSTKVSFVERLAQHLRDIRNNRHSNKNLTALIKSNNYDFIVLEVGEFDKFELLEKEKHYTELYNVHEEGYNINVGGCREIITEYPRNALIYDKTDSFYRVKSILDSKYMNRRIYPEDKLQIIKLCNELGYKEIRSSNFVTSIKRFGYDVVRLSSKRDYIIKEMKVAV